MKECFPYCSHTICLLIWNANYYNFAVLCGYKGCGLFSLLNIAIWGTAQTLVECQRICVELQWRYVTWHFEWFHLIHKVITIIDSQWNNEKNMYNFVICTASADGLAPLDARPLVGTRTANVSWRMCVVVKQIQSNQPTCWHSDDTVLVPYIYIYMGLALERLWCKGWF